MLLNPAMKKESLEYDYVRRMAKEKPFGETIGSFIQFVKQNDNEGLYCPLEWGTDHKNYQCEN